MNSQPTSYPRPLPVDLPGFEVEETVARMMDDAELWWRVLAMFGARFADWDSALLQSQAEQDAERKCVHALRSAAVNVGALRLGEAAGALENALMAGELSAERLAPLRAHLLHCFSETRQSVALALSDKQAT